MNTGLHRKNSSVTRTHGVSRNNCVAPFLKCQTPLHKNETQKKNNFKKEEQTAGRLDEHHKVKNYMFKYTCYTVRKNRTAIVSQL